MLRSFSLSLSMVLIAATIPVTSNAFAGIRDSGGGQGVVCRNPDGSIKSIELLDLWEAREVHGLTLAPPTGSVDDITTAVLKNFSHAINADQVSIASTGKDGKVHKLVGSDALFNILQQTRIEFLDPSQPTFANVHRLKNVKLTLTTDAYEEVQPNDCAIEQIVRYDDYSILSGNITINQDLWDHMDATNQAALVSHEALYKMLRDFNQESNSLRVRRAVGLAFSGYQFHILTEAELKNKNYYRCFTKTDSFVNTPDPLGPSQLYFVEEPSKDDSKKMSAVIHLIVLGGAWIIDDNGLEKNDYDTFPAPNFTHIPEKSYFGSNNGQELFLRGLIQPELAPVIRINKTGLKAMQISIGAHPSIFQPDGLPFRTATCTYHGK